MNSEYEVIQAKRDEIITYLKDHLKRGIDPDTYFDAILEESGSVRVYGQEVTFEIAATDSRSGNPNPVTF